MENRIIATVSDQVTSDCLNFFDRNSIPYVSKPFEMWELLALIRSVTKLQSAHLPG
jgi:DNA-binding response OmpR family regulator